MKTLLTVMSLLMISQVTVAKTVKKGTLKGDLEFKLTDKFEETNRQIANTKQKAQTKIKKIKDDAQPEVQEKSDIRFWRY